MENVHGEECVHVQRSSRRHWQPLDAPTAPPVSGNGAHVPTRESATSLVVLSYLLAEELVPSVWNLRESLRARSIAVWRRAEEGATLAHSSLLGRRVSSGDRSASFELCFRNCVVGSRERTLLSALDQLSSSTLEVFVSRADGMSQNVLKVRTNCVCA